MKIGKDGVEEQEEILVEEHSIPMQEDKAQELLNQGFGKVRK